MRLLLVRHAQTTANAQGALSTAAPGPDLTDLGREQADTLANLFEADHLEGRELAGIYVSTLSRTRQTIEPTARLLGIVPVEIDGIQEIEAGDFEGTTDEESMRAYLAPIRRWAEGDLGAAISGAYDGRHFLDRFDGALAAIHAEQGDDATVAVVSHAGALRVWLGGRTQNLDPAFSATHRLDNAGVVVVDGSPEDGWYVVRWQGEALESAPPASDDPIADDRAAADPLGEAAV